MNLCEPRILLTGVNKISSLALFYLRAAFLMVKKPDDPRIMSTLETNLEYISEQASLREDEHDAFREFLSRKDAGEIDQAVHLLNKEVSAGIDCTSCGNCCSKLMISILPGERSVFAGHYGISQEEADEKYLSTSIGGKSIMTAMPCVFLDDKKCTIYSKRFTDCREFPHLHQPGFTRRLWATLTNYAICPIIYNVVEKLKVETGFVNGNQ